jgi:hypothetical protein
LRPPNEEVKEHADRPNTIITRTIGTTKDSFRDSRPRAGVAVDVGAAIVDGIGMVTAPVSAMRPWRHCWRRDD